ncbi:MAG TPA: ABC transporter permease subunit [Candidatus Limnocylindrales bacterium]|nr:ABC transporter permease subunit [Candidatus Limnocylindrales bacterium]
MTLSGRSINRIGLLIAFLPFLVFCAMFELIPVVALLLGSIGGIDRHSLEWIAKVFTNPIFQKSIFNSLLLSVTSSLLGAVLGTAIGYGMMRTSRTRIRSALIALASISSNAGGVGLGFAFITILGSAGMITILLRSFGIDLLSFFSIYTVIGLIVVYLYFQIPLMIVLMLPAFAGLQRDWAEASDSLGGNSRDYWRRIGIPVLMPSIVAGTVLLFVSSMGAYATAQALIGSRINLMTIQISILRRGEILYQPAQADAMAVVLLFMVALSVLAYHLIQRRAQRWIKA